MATNDLQRAVAFVGLGSMGGGMARNLVMKGFNVRGYDVSAAALAAFEKAGGNAVPSAVDAVKGTSTCVIMVANDKQCDTLLWSPQGGLEGGVASALPQNSTLIIMSTLSPRYIKSIGLRMEQERPDVLFIDSPVSGGASRAAQGTLSVMAAGKPAAIAAGRPVLEALADSGKLFVVDELPRGGNNMKMAHQVLASIHILGVSESMGLAERLGMDVRALWEKIASSESDKGWSWMWLNRGSRAKEKAWQPPESALTIIQKDVGIVTSEAQLSRFPAVLASTAEQVFLAGVVQGFGADDDGSVLRLYAPDGMNSATLVQTDTGNLEELIINFLHVVNVCAAVEAVSFAHARDLDITQFVALCRNAAGTSSAFRELADSLVEAKMGTVAAEASQLSNTETVQSLIDTLQQVLSTSQAVKCPMFLGSATLNLLLVAKSRGLGNAPCTQLVHIYS